MTGYTTIDAKEWCFERIRALDAERANRLEAAGSPDQLIAELTEALRENLHHNELRTAVDSKDNRSIELRAIVQFRTSPELPSSANGAARPKLSMLIMAQYLAISSFGIALTIA